MTRQQTAGGLPSWAEPELATLTRERFSDPEWVFERKLDGERCLGFADSSGARLMSRNQHDISTTFPEVARALAAQRHGDLIVDGEVVAFDGQQTRFERLQHRLGVVHPGDALLREIPVYYYVFDVLYADDKDVRPLPLLERKEILVRRVDFRDPLRFTEHREGDGEDVARVAGQTRPRGGVGRVRDIPERDRPVRASGGDRAAVRGERDREDRLGVAVVEGDGRRRGVGEVDEGGARLARPDGEVSTVGGERHAPADGVLQRPPPDLVRLGRVGQSYVARLVATFERRLGEAVEAARAVPATPPQP